LLPKPDQILFPEMQSYIYHRCKPLPIHNYAPAQHEFPSSLRL
jgi:hypothetical protein